ncbi:hypothetical protein [Streptosporangium roseum]|uniref:hypothetical protein n=1 Tax=Streptosporangium roseum TaxID=2001 RepID=UPI0012DF729A|nr:hypothetical protein [Streptosporangium roseum]
MFSYLAAELRSGDIAVAGSDSYANLHDQLMCREECASLDEKFCIPRPVCPLTKGRPGKRDGCCYIQVMDSFDREPGIPVSDQVFAIDLRTGRPLWTKQDAQPPGSTSEGLYGIRREHVLEQASAGGQLTYRSRVNAGFRSKSLPVLTL